MSRSEDFRQVARVLLREHHLLRNPQGQAVVGERPEMLLVDRRGVQEVVGPHVRIGDWDEVIQALISGGVLAGTTLRGIWVLDLLRATIMIEGEPPPLADALSYSRLGLTALSERALTAAYGNLIMVLTDMDEYRRAVANLGQNPFPLRVQQEAIPDTLQLFRWASDYGSTWFVWQVTGVLGWGFDRGVQASDALVAAGQAQRIESESKRREWRKYALIHQPEVARDGDAYKVFHAGAETVALVEWLLKERLSSFTARAALRNAPGLGGLAGLRESTAKLIELGWLRYMPSMDSGRRVDNFLERSWAVDRIERPDGERSQRRGDLAETACLNALHRLCPSERSPLPTTETVAKIADWDALDVAEALRRLAIAGKVREHRWNRGTEPRRGRLRAVRWSPVPLADPVTHQLSAG